MKIYSQLSNLFNKVMSRCLDKVWKSQDKSEKKFQIMILFYDLNIQRCKKNSFISYKKTFKSLG